MVGTDVALVVTLNAGNAEQVLAFLKPYRAHVMTEARRQALATARARSPPRLRRQGGLSENALQIAARCPTKAPGGTRPLSQDDMGH